MAQTSTNVSGAKPAVGGALYVAPASTTLPTDATTALANTFISLGYISEDGLTNSFEIASDFIKAWGGDKVMPVADDSTETYKCTLIEGLNTDVLKEVYGSDNVSGTLAAGITVNHKDIDLTEKVYVVDMILRGGVLKRIVIPRGAVTEVGEIKYAENDAIGYEITITAMADSNGNKAIDYIAQP
ncbi:MAG: phage tail protein [Mogibacterium sp.]|nr:phage tail protein [Mogibacterium sp.]